jgi:hypothetical protein
MSRKLRIEYPGAIYHVMNRGDQREDIFRDELLACRIREETTMSLKWIAQRLHMGSWTYVSNLLNEQPPTQSQAQAVLPLCQ